MPLPRDLRPLSCGEAPRQSFPPRSIRSREQARDQEEGCRQVETFEKWYGSVQTVLITVIEGQGYRAWWQGSPLLERVHGLAQGHNIGDSLQKDKLAFEGVHPRISPSREARSGLHVVPRQHE